MNPIGAYLPHPNDKEFELAPAGTHLAQCYRVIDLGTQTTSYNGQEKRQHKILVSWELPEEKMSDGRPFTVGQRYTWSMSEKASLRRDLESWRGKPFGEKDFGPGGFDIRNIIGAACLLNIVHTENNGKTYANIASVAKLMKGQQSPPKPNNETVFLWIDRGLWSEETFNKLSDGLKGLIVKSPEYQSMAHNQSVTTGNDLNDEIPY